MENKDEEKKKGNIFNTISDVRGIVGDVNKIWDDVKVIYGRRESIARKVNALSLIWSVFFTLFYVAYSFLSGLVGKLNVDFLTAIYVLLGVYALLILSVGGMALYSKKVKAANVKLYKKLLKYFKIATQCVALILSIVAINTMMLNGTTSALDVAVQILLMIITVFSVIFQILPLLGGGIVGFLRWLAAPPKVKLRFSEVLVEWYNLVTAKEKKDKKEKKVKTLKRKVHGKVSDCIDQSIIPALGKRYITTIDSTMLEAYLASTDSATYETANEILQAVFEYALSCKYITTNPYEGIVVPTKKTIAPPPIEKQSGFMSRFFGGKKEGDSQTIDID